MNDTHTKSQTIAPSIVKSEHNLLKWKKDIEERNSPLPYEEPMPVWDLHASYVPIITRMRKIQATLMKKWRRRSFSLQLINPLYDRKIKLFANLLVIYLFSLKIFWSIFFNCSIEIDVIFFLGKVRLMFLYADFVYPFSILFKIFYSILIKWCKI